MAILGEPRPGWLLFEPLLRSRRARPARPCAEQTGEEEPKTKQEAAERKELGGQTKREKVHVGILATDGFHMVNALGFSVWLRAKTQAARKFPVDAGTLRSYLVPMWG